MDLKNMRNYHEVIFTKFGIDTEKNCYEACVEQLIVKFLDLNKQIHSTERERFEEELEKLKTIRTN